MNRSSRIGRVRRPSFIGTAVASLAALITLCGGIASPVEAAVVAHWAFEDDFLDSSGNGNDLTVAAGNPSFDATVPAGGFSTKSAKFDTSDGSDQLNNTSPNGLDFTSAYSVAGWVKTTTPASGKYHAILWRGVTGGNSDIEIYNAYSGKLTVAHNRSNGGSFDFIYYAEPPDDTLCHLAVTYDSSEPTKKVRVYYDGVEQTHTYQTPDLAAPIATAGHDISIGKLDSSEAWQANSFYNGLLDELFVFNKTLTKTQIDSLIQTNDATTLYTGILYDGEATGPGGRAGDKLIDDGAQDALFHGSGVSVDTTAANARLGDGSFHFDSYSTSGFSTIELPNSSELGTEFTLAAFVNPTENDVSRLFSAYNGSSISSTELIFDFDPSGTNPWVKGLRAAVNGAQITPDTPITFTTGEYHHLAMTYDDGLVITYLDGVEQARGPAGSGMVSLFANLRFGEDSYGGANEQFVGNVDELLLLYEALSPEMIAGLAQESYLTLVPEPATCVLLLLGVLGLGWRRK